MSGGFPGLREKLSEVDVRLAAALHRVRRLQDERLRLYAAAVTVYRARKQRACEWDEYELAEAGRACPGSPTSRCIYGVTRGAVASPCFFCYGRAEATPAPPETRPPFPAVE